jgi:hypothetical protein
MSRFIIKQDNPFTHQNQILKFWQEDLPETPVGRLEWMMSGNPAGRSSWFFAFDRASGALAGMISVMPKDLILGDRKVRAGIVGDLVVDKKFRVYGPALSLVKEVLGSLSDINVDFVYTIPNPHSAKLIEHAGFVIFSDFIHFVRPINLAHYQKKYAKWPLSILPSIFLELGLKIGSRDTYHLDAGIQEEEPDGEELDNLWSSRKSDHSVMTGVRDSKFIQWRFIFNPMSKFLMLTCRNNKTKRLSGYLVYTIVDNRIHIYDLFAQTNASAFGLLKRVAKLGRKNSTVGVYVWLSDTIPFINIFKKCGYFMTGDKSPIFIYYREKLNFRQWNFLSSDRNI